MLLFEGETEIRRRYYTLEYVNIIRRVTEIVDQMHKSQPKFEKVYFSRGGWREGIDFGESGIEAAFIASGFVSVKPQELHFEQMVSLLRNAKVLAGTEGSLTHNFLFARPKTETLIVRKMRAINGYQLAVNEIAELKTEYFESNLNWLQFVSGNPWGGPFFLYVNRVLARRLGVSVRFPLREFIGYFRVWFMYRLSLVYRRIIGCAQRSRLRSPKSV